MTRSASLAECCSLRLKSTFPQVENFRSLHSQGEVRSSFGSWARVAFGKRTARSVGILCKLDDCIVGRTLVRGLAARVRSYPGGYRSPALGAMREVGAVRALDRGEAPFRPNAEI